MDVNMPCDRSWKPHVRALLKFILSLVTGWSMTAIGAF
jgi:hypothetical protein